MSKMGDYPLSLLSYGFITRDAETTKNIPIAFRTKEINKN